MKNVSSPDNSSVATVPPDATAKSKNVVPIESAPIKTIAVKPAHHDNWRETVESIVVAFMLAFLFRTFLMEAFVIPTGSMAEALYGRHKDVICQACKTQYRVGASDEVDRDGGFYRREGRVRFGFCPNCRHPQDIYDDPVFKGDRILVNKFPYELSSPKPWDVVVFKYPEDPKTNYIKRLIGLPNERITIEWGDIYVQSGEGGTQIRRKPPEKQRAIQMLVYDNDKPARELLAQGWPERWAPPTSADDGWVTDATARTFTVNQKPDDAELRWVRYRHLVPSGADWERVREGSEIQQELRPIEPQPALISDYYSYNSGYEGNNPVFSPERDMIGQNWVGDLTLDCEVRVKAAQGEVLFELVESLRRYRCTIDLKTGEATLSYQDEDLRDAGGELETVVIGREATPLSKPGKFRISFANVDDRLCLWVNDRLIKFPGKGEYDIAPRTAYRLPTEADLSPAGIAAKGANVEIAHVILQRDLYYNNEPRDENRDWRLLLSNPKSYGEYASRIKSNTYPLGSDEYFVLGDNSPRSADSRLWENRRFRRHFYAVPHNLLIGKAFFIYWPHAIPFLNNGKGYSPQIPFLSSLFYHWEKVWEHGRGENSGYERVAISDYPANGIPFYPQFGRMKRIR